MVYFFQRKIPLYFYETRVFFSMHFVAAQRGRSIANFIQLLGNGLAASCFLFQVASIDELFHVLIAPNLDSPFPFPAGTETINFSSQRMNFHPSLCSPRRGSSAFGQK